MKSVIKEYKEIQRNFRNVTNEGKSFREKYEKNIVYVNDGLLKAIQPIDREVEIADVEHYAIKIVRQLPGLLQSLQHVNDILKTFNLKRVSWVEFLIGMRKSPNSARKNSGK